MHIFWRKKYFQYTLAFIAAFLFAMLPKWEHNIIDTPSPRFLAGDTLACMVSIQNSIAAKGHSLGYIYELFSYLDNNQMCKTEIEPVIPDTTSWLALVEGSSDILIINSQRDTVPEIFQDEVISSIPINDSEDICVVSKSNYQIILVFNHWFTYFKQTPEFDDIAVRYFKNYHIKNRKGEYITRKSLSPYDNAIKENAATIGWDWRLLASLIYQESKFKAAVSSSRGAIGLMQIKEVVAKSYGIDDVYNPLENLKAGTRHIKRLQGMYRKMGADSLNTMLLTIAAYNCGEGRMEDCMSLARQEGKEYLVWDSLKEIIPLMKKEEYYTSDAIKLGKFNGKETLKYVEQVLERYGQYTEVVAP